MLAAANFSNTAPQARCKLCRDALALHAGWEWGVGYVAAAAGAQPQGRFQLRTALPRCRSCGAACHGAAASDHGPWAQPLASEQHTASAVAVQPWLWRLCSRRSTPPFPPKPPTPPCCEGSGAACPVRAIRYRQFLHRRPCPRGPPQTLFSLKAQKRSAHMSLRCFCLTIIMWAEAGVLKAGGTQALAAARRARRRVQALQAARREFPDRCEDGPP